MNLKKKKKGFTLVELMAVIAIIAILAAVLVPTVNGYIERSKKAAVVTQIRNVIAAVDAYNATSGTPIAETDKISTLAVAAVEASTSETGKLAVAQLLSSKDINKLGSTIEVEDARKINSDPDAINKITLTSGVLSSFTGVDITD